MKKKSIIFLFVGIAMLTQAQSTYNDLVRTRRWSALMQLGVSNHIGMRGKQYVGDSKAAPMISLGVAYNPDAAWRFDVNLGYSYLYRSADDVLAKPPQSTSLGKQPCTDRNITHVIFSDMNFSYNLMDLFHQRYLQKLNVWLGVGFGLMHGHNHHEQTWEIETDTDAWTEVKTRDIRPNTIYLPFTLMAEYDITPKLTLGLSTQYRALPLKRIHTPKTMWYTAITVRYNIGIKRTDHNSIIMQKLLESYRDQAQYRDMLRQAAENNNALIDKQNALRDSNELLLHENDSLVDLIIDLRDERSRLRQEVSSLKSNAKTTENEEAVTLATTALMDTSVADDSKKKRLTTLK